MGGSEAMHGSSLIALSPGLALARRNMALDHPGDAVFCRRVAVTGNCAMFCV
jgi:hypothetical protein